MLLFLSSEKREQHKFYLVSEAHYKAPHDTALSNTYYLMVDGLITASEAYKRLKKKI